MTAFNRTLAPVLNGRGAVIAIFALTMIVPLAVAMLAGERAPTD